jgi:GTP cyclohydrolase I
MTNHRTILSWAEVYARLATAPPGPVWGVPRGGQIVAGLTGRAVDRPEDAAAIVDDLVDSGRTRDRYRAQYPDLPFWPLLDKRPGDGWIVFPWEDTDPAKDLEDTVVRQLEWLGEDPRREGLRDTPRRVLKALDELTAGRHGDPAAILAVQFTEACDELILVRDIPFYSLCEHHMLPFHGQVTVGYIPAGDRVVGLSKIPRLVECFARRLQTQERLTGQIAEALATHLQARGVGVLIDGSHTCMAMRGVRASGRMTTSALLGILREPAARHEFVTLARA